MKTDFEMELKTAAQQVNELIRNDFFPETIRPEELRSAVRAYPSVGGKRLRPAMLLWSCGMFNGNPATALPAAAAVEIFHNWTLVHDDIIDCDSFRRGVPTSHTEIARYAAAKFGKDERTAQKYGNDIAILAGDAQQAWAVSMLLRLTEKGVDPALVIALSRRMQDFLNRELISGEAIDVQLAMRDAASVNEEKVLHMIAGKTSALLAYSVQCGAAIAKNSADFENDPDQKLLFEFASKLGLAYQLQDDLLGVYGEIEQFGKPLCSDFKDRKPTLLYLEAKRRLKDEDAEMLVSMTGCPFYSTQMVDMIRDLLDRCGAAEAVRQRGKMLTEEALAALKQLPANRYRDLLKTLTNVLLNRNI